MMDTGLAIRGLVIGFTVAAAVGPISLLTIRRTLAHGRVYGLVSGLGVATADATYAGIAAFGLTAVTTLLVSGRVVLGLVGGIVIVYLGLRTIRSHPGPVATAAERPGLPGAYGSIFALTMTNPMTILSFAAIFAGVGFAVGGTGLADALVITLGVWLGSSLWWVILTAVVAWARERVSTRGLTWVNRASGSALVVFGLVAIGLAVTAASATA
jgi:threonine/homoserine/homoserine lactone efflux protein